MGANTQILLVRHGESVWNAEGRLQGQADPHLSARGIEQAEALGRRLTNRRFAVVYCSPAQRARATAQVIAAPHGLIPRIDPSLLEVDLGSWQGSLVSDMSEGERLRYDSWALDLTSMTPPDGEVLECALSRVARGFQAILRDHAGETVVVVTHSIIGRLALSYLLDMPLQLASRLRLKKASISKLRVEGGHAVLERLSDTSHLRAR